MSRKLFRVFLLFFTFAMCYPLIFVITGSLMGEYELMDKIGSIFENVERVYVSFSVLPKEPNVWSYVKILFDSPEFLTAFWNTVRLSCVVVVLQCFVNIPAAWGLAIYNFKGKRFIIKLYIVILVLPFQVLMLPQYLVLDKLGLLNTIWSIVFPMLFSPLFIFIVFYFLKKIPNAVIESARAEGAGEWTIFWKIGLPLAKNGILAAVLLSVIEVFNMIEQPLLFLKNKSLWTISLYLPNAKIDGIGTNFAMTVLSALPILLLFLYGQDYIQNESEMERMI